MREVGHLSCGIDGILDVSPDLWACVIDKSLNEQLLLGPHQERVPLQPSAFESDGQEMDLTLLPSVGRFNQAKTTYDLALGYSNGSIRVFNRSGKELFAVICHFAPLLKLEWSLRGTTRELWALFADKTLVVIEWEVEPTPKRSWRKYTLHGQQDILAIVPCAELRSPLFQAHTRVGLHNAMAIGCAPAVGFFHAGNDAPSILHIAQIASAVATKAAGAVWSLAKNWGWSSEKPAAEASPTPLNVAAELGLTDDHRHKAKGVSLSPNGRLALVCDTLGRISLVDTSSMLIIRLWKGYRDAQCGWMTMNGSTDIPGLYMVFYSARRGLIEVWRSRYGPRVLVLPIGVQAKLKLFTLTASQQTQCIVVHEKEDNDTFLHPVELDASSKTTILKYFSQDHRQEETFLLHQLLDSIHVFRESTSKSKLDDILTQMSQITTIAGVDAVVETLLAPNMAHVPGLFLCEALLTLLPIAKKVYLGDDITSATYAQLAAIFLLEWKLHIFQGYIKLQEEHTKVFASSSSLFDEDLVLKKLQHWDKCLELARQSPLPQDTSANEHSFGCLQFLDCFSVPMRKSNVSLDTERTLFLCLQRYYKREIPFVECLDLFHSQLEIPILQPSLFQSEVHRVAFIKFCFEPLATSVFAVQSVQAIHETLQLPTTEHYTSLFLEWYFGLSTAQVLEMTGATSSSPLQRWLQPWIHAGSYPHTLEDEGSFTLPEMSDNLKTVFEHCRSSTKLVHSYILANHIDIGTKNYSLDLQESTLGQISTTGAGLRWRVLQQCLSHCFYFSCLLRIPGKLSVQSVEGVDELLRAVAIVQLHQASQEFEEPVIPFDLEDAWTEEWIKQLDANGAIRFVSSVLLAFRQLQHADALKCFRATVLCGAWHSDRSQMSYLEMALDEISQIERSSWKKALLVHIWESFVRVHIGSILAYWVDVASGRSLRKGLQPSIARHFLNLGRQLLDLLEIELTTNDPTIRMEISDEALRTAQLLDHIAWTGTDTDVLALYATQWPPRCEASALVATMQQVPLVPLAAVQLHCQILAVLDAFTAVPNAAMPLKRLFYNAALCEPDGLTTLPITVQSACQQERYNFVLRLLRDDATVGFNVATTFDLPLDPIKKDHGVYLYQCGHDGKGEEVLGNLVLESDISERLASIARTRLALVLSRMRSRAEYAALMTRMPADVCTWVCSNEPPLLPDKRVHELDKAPSITATFVILQQCLQWFPPPTLQHKKCNSMVALVKSLLDQLKAKQ